MHHVSRDVQDVQDIQALSQHQQSRPEQIRSGSPGERPLVTLIAASRTLVSNEEKNRQSLLCTYSGVIPASCEESNDKASADLQVKPTVFWSSRVVQE